MGRRLGLYCIAVVGIFLFMFGLKIQVMDGPCGVCTWGDAVVLNRFVMLSLPLIVSIPVLPYLIQRCWYCMKILRSRLVSSVLYIVFAEQ
jgi:hypothetical protein